MLRAAENPLPLSLGWVWGEFQGQAPRADKQARAMGSRLGGRRSYPCDGWPGGWGRLQTGSRQQDQRPQVLSVSCFVLALRGSAAQQFLHEFCFLPSCQITLIFSHFNLGRFSKPGPPAKRIVYQRSHLSVLLRQGQNFLVALVNKSPVPKSAANSDHNYLLWSTYCRSSLQISLFFSNNPLR